MRRPSPDRAPTRLILGAALAASAGMAAPSQHEQGYYEAFGIRAGDRMWLDASDRVTIW